MNNPKRTQPALPPYNDRQECLEVFADTVQAAHNSGVVRIEFCVFRLDADNPSNGMSRRVPVARVVIPLAFLAGVRNNLSSLLSAVEAQEEKGAVSSAPTAIH